MAMKDINQIMYIIVGKSGRGDVLTLAYTKTECIKKFLEISTMKWVQAKRFGWKCVKVDVNITTAENIWQ